MATVRSFTTDLHERLNGYVTTSAETSNDESIQRRDGRSLRVPEEGGVAFSCDESREAWDGGQAEACPYSGHMPGSLFRHAQRRFRPALDALRHSHQ
jgi:hypothetical protein